MAGANITGKEYPVHKVFSSDFVFSIPLYQRPYAWTTEEAGALLSDLMGYVEENALVSELNPYFLGSIVLIKEENPDADVVDGQQRLTTLTILLAVLRDALHEKGDAAFADNLTKSLYEKEDLILGTPNRYRLSLRELDRSFFKQHVQEQDGLQKLAALDGFSLSDSQKQIKGNAAYFQKELEKYSVERIRNLAFFLLTRCFLIVVSTPNIDSAYRIFSVLNDRGMDLLPTDILKSEIIGKMNGAAQAEYTKKWEEAEENLGRDAFRDLFSHIRTIYRKAKPQDTLLKEFRAHVKATDDPAKFVDEVLTPYAAAFDTIRNANYQSAQNADEVNRLLVWLNRIDNFDWQPSAMAFFARHANKTPEIIEFLTRLERLAAGMMIRRADVNRRLERYARVVREIESGTILLPASSLTLEAEEIVEILKMLNGDLYLQGKIRLYVLLRLDQALSASGAAYAPPKISIEHVLPQNPIPNSQWIQDFPDANQREQTVHKLGNLVLLNSSKNSQAQNFDFNKKKQTYFMPKGGITIFALTTQVLNEAQWTPQIIARRQTELINRLKSVWDL